MNQAVKLNLGCGAQTPDGWIHVDFAPGARFAKFPFFRSINKKLKLFDINWNRKIIIHNLTKKFPWKESSVDVIYSSHTLEHFTREDGRRFLSECYRVLRKDGIIRIVVPDLRSLVDEYLKNNIPADQFVENLGVLYENRSNVLKKHMVKFIEFPHKCMYDSRRLIEIMRDIGFDVSCRAAFDSDIPDIRTIELEERTENAVIAEGRKT